MREMFAWAIPLLVSLFLIQIAAEALYLRAASQVTTTRTDPGVRRDSIRGPVHEVDRDVTAGGIIT